MTFYNTPELQRAADDSYKRTLQVAQRLFPNGQAVAIIEPYFKVSADGAFGVRVDNPAEVGLTRGRPSLGWVWGE